MHSQRAIFSIYWYIHISILSNGHVPAYHIICIKGSIYKKNARLNTHQTFYQTFSMQYQLVILRKHCPLGSIYLKVFYGKRYYNIS